MEDTLLYLVELSLQYLLRICREHDPNIEGALSASMGVLGVAFLTHLRDYST